MLTSLSLYLFGCLYLLISTSLYLFLYESPCLSHFIYISLRLSPSLLIFLSLSMFTFVTHSLWLIYVSQVISFYLCVYFSLFISLTRSSLISRTHIHSLVISFCLFSHVSQSISSALCLFVSLTLYLYFSKNLSLSVLISLSFLHLFLCARLSQSLPSICFSHCISPLIAH